MNDIYDNDRRYLTTQWRRLRLSVLRRDSFMCQDCVRKGISKEADTVHHIEPGVSELFYDTTNLISLCASCHDRMHNRMTGELTAEGTKWVRRRRRGLVPRVGL
jgi:5-methylcytosine-specific restriction endonuclease McrA